jgi:subtilisin family serine protease
MPAGRTLQPWAHLSGTYALPTSILVRLKLGEATDTIPAALDVRAGAAEAARSTGHSALDRVITRFASSISVSRLHAAARALKSVGSRNRGYSEAEEISGVSRVLRLDVAPGTHVGSMAISLMQLSVVESALPNYICTLGLDGPDTPAASDDGWEPRDMINARKALAWSAGDSSVIVGVVDSGVNPAHPEFSGKLRRGYDTVQLGAGDLPGGVTLVGDNSGADLSPVDKFVGHGTGCAAIISGRGDAMPLGIAGDCPVLPLRSLGSAQFPGRTSAVGVGAISDLDMGLVMAVQLGARVINCSFGTDDEALEPGAPKPHSEAVAFASERGCALVAASGNSGDRRTYWPAGFPEVISCGSVGPDRHVSSFSTSADYVALCAPGERVRTAALNGYQAATGTSFAAPFVSGAAALLIARAQERSAPIDPPTIKSILMASAQPHVDGTPPGNGAGILDAARALELLDASIDADETTELGGADDG